MLLASSMCRHHQQFGGDGILFGFISYHHLFYLYSASVQGWTSNEYPAFGNTDSLCVTFPNCHSLAILHKFVFMQVQVDIGFDQLLKIVKTLPSGQLKQLKAEIEKEAKSGKSVDLETLLLNGPTATKKQLDTIARNRKAINQWRTK